LAAAVLAGILSWHQGCHRYTEADLISNTRPARPELFGSPTGLGTSAIRILRTIRTRSELALNR